MLGSFVLFAGVLAAVALTLIAIFVPNTRAGTHEVRLKGSVDEVWDVYTDPASLPDWRRSVAEIADLSGKPGARSWTEVSSHGLRIDFVETKADAPFFYALRTHSNGYFNGRYSARFEQVKPNEVKGTFTEEFTTQGLRSKLLALIFVRPERLIKEFAQEAQAEITRRSRR